MKKSFRKRHLTHILKEFDQILFDKSINIPLDHFLSNYFRNNKSIGSKDRKEIADKVYFIYRWRGFIDNFIEDKPIIAEKRVDFLDEFEHFENFLNEQKENKQIAFHVRASFPKRYFQKIVEIFENEKNANEKALNLCHILNSKAPTTVRTNTLNISREELYKIFLSKNYKISKTKRSPYGIVFHKKINFFAEKEFKEGLFEIQDEGSQMIADLFDPSLDMKDANKKHFKYQMLDFCAGAGGKSLLFALKMHNKGQLYLHDIREKALIQAKKRLKRANVQNYQIILNKDLKKVKKKFDWIYLDVPCSGSGTLRRNPDLKWKFDFSSFDNLLNLQREIFEKAFYFLKQKKFITYATCSLFREENEYQKEFFLKKYNLTVIKEISILPEKGASDGFYGVTFQKN